MPLGILLFLRRYEPIISALGFFLAIAAIFLLFYVERVRRPNLQFLDHEDKVTNDNRREGFMWHHLKVQNSYPPLLLNRDAALSSMARVDFIREGTKIPQITAHWTNQPEPRTLLLTGTTVISVFDPSKIPECQRIDVGFREEAFDFVLKFRGVGTFGVNPWIVYDGTLKPNPWSDRRARRFHPKWEELRLDQNEYVVRVEIEATNLGKRQVVQYKLRIVGPDVGDLQLTRLK